jgi:hypothetical protein
MELVVHPSYVCIEQSEEKRKVRSTEIQENIREDQFQLATRLHDRTSGCIEWIDRSSKREKESKSFLQRDKSKVKAAARRIIGSRVTARSTWHYLTVQLNDKVLFVRRRSIHHWN